jgi:periplasmic divalent cation tolerance protein
MDPVDATGPMRLVLCAFPNDAAALAAGREAVRGRLAACAQRLPVRSTYWWEGRIEEAEEVLVLFKTAPKRVGALFRHLATHHPYRVPEIVEVDIARAHEPYLRYLADTIDADAPPPPLGGGKAPTRPGSRRARAAPSPGRTRARPRRRY